MARPRTHDDSLRNQLLEETGRVIARDGYAALNLRALADSAGTSTTAIYSLFGGKDGLLTALYTQAFEGFGESQRAVGSSDDPVADLQALGRAYRAWALRHPNLFRVMFGRLVPVSDPADAAASRATIEPLMNAVGRAVAAGLVRDQTFAVAMGLWSHVHGFVTLELDGLIPAEDAEEAFEAAIVAAVHGWRTP